MSWQAYVDTSLVATGHVEKAAIISIAGDSVWASTPDFKLSDEDMKTIVGIVTDANGAVQKAFGEGIHLMGERYVVTKIEDGKIYARQNKLGFVAAKTKQAVLVGHYNETQIAGNTASVVEALADYLTNTGY